MEATGGAEAAAEGDIGKRQGCEAQQVINQAEAVGDEEVMAGLAAEAADKA